MKLLIVAATQGELLPIPAPITDKHHIDILITGVGMVATSYALTKQLLSAKYDLVLQVGVCGSFNRDIQLGDVVFITSDRYGDLGAEDHDNYIDFFDMELLGPNAAPFSGGKLNTPLLPVHDKIALPRASALTINTVSGNERTIKLRKEQYGCDTESMEGAAFHYVCLQESVPFAQVRAVSNYVIPRDKSQWKMKDAIINLNKWLVEFLKIVP